MQRLIAKYGLAAHLALAAAAPLFLFPFFDSVVIAKVWLWLSGYAAMWMLMEPSIRTGEHLHDARKRVVGAIARDPLFWAMLVLVVLSGLVWINDGIRLAYDAENQVWSLAKPAFPILPGSVTGCGELPFAGMVLMLVVLTACRQALGKAARMVFFFLTSLFAGLAAVMAIFMASQGQAVSLAAMRELWQMRSYVGAVFGIYLLAGTVAMVFAVERRWFRAVPAFFLAIGGSMAGLVAYAPGYVILAFLGAELFIAGYSFLFAMFVLKSASEFKFFSIFMTSIGFAALLVMAVLPGDVMAARLATFTAWDFFPVGFENTRVVLSDVAFRVWKEHLWIGSGLGSFPLDIRFFAVGREWAAIPLGTKTVPNAMWQMLSECGLVGAVQLLVPFGFLFFVYLCRLVREVRGRHIPHPAGLVAPVAVAAVVAISCFDCTVLRMDCLLALCATFALSANSFHKETR